MKEDKCNRKKKLYKKRKDDKVKNSEESQVLEGDELELNSDESLDECSDECSAEYSDERSDECSEECSEDNSDEVPDEPEQEDFDEPADVSEVETSELAEDLERDFAEDAKLFKEAEERYMRLAAEFDNFRKRSKREKEVLYDKSIADVVTEFLPLLDNLDRAIEAGDKGGKNAQEAMLEGIQLLKKQAVEMFAKFGVEEIDALNHDFDPNFHEAALHIEDDEYGENQVVEVFSKGYKRDDRVLRHSVVKVAN